MVGTVVGPEEFHGGDEILHANKIGRYKVMPMDVYIEYNHEFGLAICRSCQCGIPSNYIT
jgi:hypothetical protein